MCDPVVYLYVIQNREDTSTDQKICDIIHKHISVHGIVSDAFPANEAPLIRRTVRGKPYFPAFPNLHLSVTHSGKWFICALSGQPVGIDLQEHTLLQGETQEQALVRYCRIARRFFHRSEAAFVEENAKDRFFSVWTAKESYVKYTGQGMDQYFDSFCVLNPSSDISTKLPTDIAWQAEQVFFRQMCFDGAYTFCMCTADACHWRWTYLNQNSTQK